MEIGVPVWLFALRYVLAAPENPLSTADTCFKIHALEFIFQFAHNILAAILRGIGSGKASLYFLRIACVFVAPGIPFACIFKWAWQERRSPRSAQIAFCAAAFVPQQRPGRRKALPAPPTAQSRDSAGSSSKRAPLSTPYRAGMRTEVKNLLVNVLRHPYRAGARAILVQPRFSLPRAASHLTGIRLPRPLPCIQYFIPR